MVKKYCNHWNAQNLYFCLNMVQRLGYLTLWLTPEALLNLLNFSQDYGEIKILKRCSKK